MTATCRKMKKLKPSVFRDFVFRQCSEIGNGLDVYVNKGEPTADSLAVVRYLVEPFEARECRRRYGQTAQFGR